MGIFLDSLSAGTEVKQAAGLMVSYIAARPQIRDSDLLLSRPTRQPWSQWIAATGRSDYSHASKVAWWGDRLFNLEMIQWRGGQATLLSHLVQQWPGYYDLFELVGATDAQRSRIVGEMQAMCGVPYGWRSAAKLYLANTPIVRFFVRVNTDDVADGRDLFCSAVVSRADRAAGLDPVPHLSDADTLPGDLARSNLYRYRFTLV